MRGLQGEGGKEGGGEELFIVSVIWISHNLAADSFALPILKWYTGDLISLIADMAESDLVRQLTSTSDQKTALQFAFYNALLSILVCLYFFSTSCLNPIDIIFIQFFKNWLYVL